MAAEEYFIEKYLQIDLLHSQLVMDRNNRICGIYYKL